MKQRIITIILLVSCVILGVAAFFVSVTKDKKAPEISVSEKDVTYVEGTGYKSLLEGVSAKDNRDGDVSDKVFVDRVIPMAGGEQAVVYYAVTDKSNNVGTAKRVVSYSKDGSDVQASKPEEKKEETPDEQEPAENSEPEADQPDNTPAQGLYPPDPIDTSSGKPVVQVKAQENTVAVGSVVNLMDYINNIYDADMSNENHDYMYAHVSITVNGAQSTSTFNAGAAGTHEIQYMAGNRNGAVSDPTVMTLIVQ